MMVAAVALLALLIGSNGEAGFYSGNKLHHYCDASDYFSQGACIGYIIGVEDAAAVVNESGIHELRADRTWEERLNGFHWCTPEHATAEQLADVVKKWLTNNPKWRDTNAAGIVAAALWDAFPCK